MKTYNKKEITIFNTVIKKLQFIAAFPEDGKTYSFLRCVGNWFPYTVFGGPLAFGMLGRLYQDVKEKRLFHLIYEAYTWNLMLMFYSILIILINRGDTVVQFLSDLSRHDHGRPKDYYKTMVAVDKAARIVYYGVSSIIVMLGIGSYTYYDVFCNTEELVNDHHYLCRSYVAVWYPVEINIPIVRPLFALYSMGISLYHIPNIACAIVLIYGSVKFIVMRIEHLKLFLKEVDFDEDYLEKSRSKMIFSVDYYSEISKLVRQMNNTVGYMYAPSQNANWDVMLGLLGYQATKQLDLIAAIQFVSWLAVEGMVCYAGQLLENASSSLQEELYDIPWYNMQPPLRPIFKTFHMEVHRTLHFIVQPNLQINFQYFKKVIQGSYSFIMFLKKF